MKIFTSMFVGLALTFLVGFNAFGTDIYNTFPSTNGASFSVTNGQQVGNQITLNSSQITMSEFSFEYFTTTPFSGTNGVDLKLYNGAPTGPSIYDSGVFSPLPAAPAGTNVNYSAGFDFPLNFLLPTNFTFILTFSLVPGDSLQLLLANPPSGQPGSTTTNYWYNYSGGPGLTLSALASGSADIGVTITGTVKTPDAPVTAGLLGMGLMGIFVLHRKFAQNLI
jgi:hypothetical protein